MTEPHESDIEHRPPPINKTGYGAFGTRAVRTVHGNRGVRLMMKNFSTLIDEAGEMVVYIDVTVPAAAQLPQAIRQAVTDAKNGTFR